LTDLSRKRDRDRLAIRREPYWHRLDGGAHLGFRRGPDTWVARYRGRDKERQYKALNVPLGASDAFIAAKRLAESWIEQMGGSAVRTVKRGTVRAALEAYLADLRRHGRHDAALEAQWRYRATLYRHPEQAHEDDDALADVDLESVSQDDFLDWRDRLTEGRQPRTINRYVRAVVAGLNRALQLGHVGNPAAWSLTGLADDVEDEGETAVFLTSEQRALLLKSASGTPIAAFLRGLELTGARPKELANANAGDFDGESLRLAHKKGRPPKLRVRRTMLSAEGAKFFNEQIADKLPGAPLFTEDGEQRWRRHVWSKQTRAAIAEANKDKETKGKKRIPAGASAYSFRHSRISELLQIHGVDPLTVANQTGTSLAVIEKTYFKFIPSAMREKLAAVKDA
jgi:integrase